MIFNLKLAMLLAVLFYPTDLIEIAGKKL